jgi:predicted RNA binding protein YcfA (HicA-like mRNA interferase family)
MNSLPIPMRRKFARCAGEASDSRQDQASGTLMALAAVLTPRLQNSQAGQASAIMARRPNKKDRCRNMGLMPMKVREVIRLIERQGWVEMRSKGSHRHFKHPNQAFVITVPGNEGKELAPGTLNDILKKAGLK